MGGTYSRSNLSDYTYWYYVDDDPAGYHLLVNGSYTSVDLAITNGITTHNASVVVGEFASDVMYLSGITAGVENGFLSLGGSPIVEAYGVPKSLYGSSVTESNSFGLHIGVGGLGYPGSLVFRGYDKGRIIGPVISYSSYNEDVSLVDIIIGVETGDSPFDFANQSGLLWGTDSTTTKPPVPCILMPEIPYITLPQGTLDRVTRDLPVKFDSESGYYLWDTADSSYSTIVSSPAYLGFVFSSAAGNATMKVPFTLLNLTLESSISGLDSDLPYLPLVVREGLQQFNQVELLFGRAFLQSAFIGTDWNNNVS